MFIIFNKEDILDEVQLLNRLDFKFELLDPRLEVIQELPMLESVTINKQRNTLAELSFSISAGVKMKFGTPLETLRPHYVIRAKSSFETLYFLILKQDIRINEKEEMLSFKVSEYPRQLAKNIIFEYEEDSKSLDAVVKELLKVSAWEIGYVEGVFRNSYRGFSFRQVTLLEAIQKVAENFNALIQWNSDKKTIDFLLPTRLGVNKGLVLSEDKYLKGLDYKIDAEEVITQLHAYGKDNISIAKLTPTGSPYLEDYSWFMYPFKQDEQGKVLQSSKYMTDGLCKSIIAYQEVLKKNEGVFNNLLEEREKEDEKLFGEWLTLTELEIELKTVTDELDVLNSTQAEKEKIEATIEEKIKVENKITKQKEVIQSIEDNIEDIKNQVKELREIVNKKNNFTRDEIVEMDNFTITRVLQDNSIEEEEDLLEVAIENFEKFKIPKITADIQLTNFLANEEYKPDWNKLDLGDVITITHEDLEIDFYAQINSITYNLATLELNVRLANENYNDTHDSFTQQLYDSLSTSTTINMDRYKWDMAEDAKDGVSQILNNAWDAAKQQIQGGVNQSVSISERGLVIKSSESPNKMLVAQNGILGLSRDGGNTWKTAITPDGVYAEELVGRIIMGNKLVIEDESGIIEIVGSTQNVYDSEGNLKVQLGELDDDKGYGISIDGGSLHIHGELNKENFDPEFIDNLMYDDTQLRKDLRLESPLPNSILLDKSGITAYTEKDKKMFARMDYRGLYVQGGALDIRTRYGTEEGVQIDGKGISGFGSDGTRTFHLDNAGNFTAQTGTFAGHLEAASGTFKGTLEAVDGIFTGTLKGTDGVFSGNLSGSVIRGGLVKGAKIEGGTLNINDQFIVDASGNMIARSGTFSGTIETAQDAIIGKQLKLNAQMDDGGIILNHREERNGRIYYDNAQSAEGQSLARLVVSGRIVKIEGVEGGIELVSTNGKTIISSKSARKPHFEFWSRDQNVYHGKIYVDNEDNFRMINATGSQLILGRSDGVGAEFRSSQGGYATVTAKEFLPMSDKNLKENIQLFNKNSLDIINNTDIYNYNFRDDKTKEKKVGLIYQDAPSEVISKNKKSINLYSMTTLSWKAIQELTDIITQQQKEIDKLKEVNVNEI